METVVQWLFLIFLSVSPFGVCHMQYKRPFTLSVSVTTLQFRLDGLDFLINQASQFKNGLLTPLIRYHASIDADAPN